MSTYCFTFFCFLIVSFSPLFAALTTEQFVRKIHAHLTIHDFVSARQEAEEALQIYPQEVKLHEYYVRVLSQIKDEKAMLKAWKNYFSLNSEKAQSPLLLEEMAWGILHKASHSSSLMMRGMALLAAYFSQQSQSVHILVQGVKDPNYAVREMAVKLASHYRDRALIYEVKRLFKEEKVWAVRQKVIAAIGSMKMKDMQGELENLIASDQSLPEEKVLAITALLEILDHINRAEIERLVNSKRAGLRQLACQAIAYFQSIRDLDQLFLLSQDSHPNVRAEAIQAIGQLHPQEYKEKILKIARQGIKETNPTIAISAAWLLTLYQQEEGEQSFHRFMISERPKNRVLAASALAATGTYGTQAALHYMRNHNDPYVRLNLALGLIGQQVAEAEALALLNALFFSEKELWMKHKEGIFQSIVQARLYESTDSLETENHLIRLEMLNLLAMRKYLGAEQTIRQFLLERSWGVSATAAASLLTEGDEEAVEIVKALLKDPQPMVRLQAALVLSLWSREENAIQTLQENYATSTKEDKAKILEGLGRIGSRNSVPFLMNVLEEPSQTLRLIGALALIQCLNH